jgi:hypothetical protein
VSDVTGEQAERHPARLVPVLAAEFPGYRFGPFLTWRGRAVHAVKIDADAPGVCEVITADLAEMRAALDDGGTGR